MTPISEKLVRDTVAGYETLSARIKEVAIQVAAIQGATRNPTDDYVEFGFDGGTFYAKFSYFCYGDCNEETVYIPLEYLWTENFVEIEKARFAAERAEEKRLAEEKAQREESERRRLVEQKERQTYERLRKKYEPLDPPKNPIRELGARGGVPFCGDH